MLRNEFGHRGLCLSYLDEHGPGPLLVALHAHWMDASTFEPLAVALAPHWRVVALDQRGHGYSDHARSYAREDYLDDLDTFLNHLGAGEPVVILGNSLGGVNAYQFAARRPDRVRALVVEDVGAEVSADLRFVLPWAGTYATREQLVAKIGPRLAPYVESSFRQTPAGWRLAFDPSEIVLSGDCLNGDHWQDWLASDCPALLIRGAASRVTTRAHFAEMASRRPRTRLETLDGGHVVHADNPVAFQERVRSFLDEAGT